MSSVDLSSPAALLKQETLTAHQRTEKVLVGRIKAIAGPADYCSILACLYGYFSPLERQLGPSLNGLFPDYALRRKSHRLLEDIQLLDPDVHLRFAETVLSATSAATAIGYAYVMEGSVLGGSFIKKMIAGRFPEIPERAFGFFSGYGEENRNMWNAFLDVLNRELASGVEYREGMAAAKACFGGMEAWMEEWFNTEASPL